MTNFQVYKKTLFFSFISFLVNILSLVLLFGLPVVGFVTVNNSSDKGLIGAVVGFVIGIIACIVIKVFLINPIKAGQVSMIMKGVTTGEIPEHVVKEGRKEVKARFLHLTAFFFVTGAIKRIFRQISNGISRIGDAVGGNAGGAISSIASIINAGIQVLLSYLEDCCLGWVFYRKEIGTAKAACEGAAIFFKHGKTFGKNIGRIVGIGLISFVLIGGAIMGILYGIFSAVPGVFQTLAAEIAEAAARGDTEISAVLTDPAMLSITIAAVGAFIVWNMIHGVLVRPFILTGVMRNFMESGIANMPTETEMANLSSKSSKFAKLQSKI